MNEYFINRISMENFKLHEEKVEIDFNKSKFIVLDGPNGYGKTTVFDAIEILVTGKLNRIFNVEYRAGDKPVLYANNPQLPIIIKGEFINSNDEKFIIMRCIDNPENKGNLSNLNERFKTYQLNQLSDVDGKEISQDEINDILGLVPNEDIYSLMNYIQQEDTIHFLKLNENERLKQINKLFNIEKEVAEAEKIKKVRDKINGMRYLLVDKDGNGEISDLSEKIKNVKKDEVEKSYKYFRLINWKEVPWDNENLVVNETNFQNIIDEIENIKKLKQYKEDFLKDRENKKLQFYLLDKNKNILCGVIILKNFLDAYEKLKEQNNLKKCFDMTISYWNKREYTKIKNSKGSLDLLENLLGEVDFQQLMLEINQLNTHKNNSNHLSDMVREINTLRNELNVSYSKLTSIEEHREFGEDTCPLCGFNYKEYNQKLINAIEKRSVIFTEKLDDNSKEISNIEQRIDKRYFKNISKEMEKKYLKDYKVEEEFINLLDKYYQYKDQIQGFLGFCENKNIIIDDYCIEESNNISIDEVEQRANEIRDLLVSKLLTVDNEYTMENVNFENVYKNYFDEQEINLEYLKIEDIIKKKEYINSEYVKKTNLKRVELEKEKKVLEAKYKILSENYTKLDEVYKKYQTNIRKYSAYIISNIEIPFYIFSGKILQDYQGGLGVFIKSDIKPNSKTKSKSDNDEQIIRITFVNQNNDKHDLLNKFSSGQLSGLVIAFVLALNSVYANNNLTSILIDDPLQSMDDINMASFIELIRNEFRNKQIVVSTHDDVLSRYMRYKFQKYGIKQLRINLKDKFINEQIN